MNGPALLGFMSAGVKPSLAGPATLECSGSAGLGFMSATLGFKITIPQIDVQIYGISITKLSGTSLGWILVCEYGGLLTVY